MNKKQGKKTIKFLALTLSLFGFSFFAFNASAQLLSSDSDISITARVLGCGDNLVSPALGEQCEGPNAATALLNGESCSSLGFDSGSLSCTNSCVFDISDCSDNNGSNSSGGSGSSTSSRKRFEKNSEKLNPKNLIFGGSARGAEQIIILNNGAYYASAKVEKTGEFSLSISDYDPGEHNFTFYAISPELGKSEVELFQIDLPESSTIIIDDIHLVYPKEIKKIPLVISGEIDQEKDDLIREVRSPLYNVLSVRIIDVEVQKSKEPVVINFALGTLISILIYLVFFMRRLFF